MKTILSLLAAALCINAGYAQTKKLAITPTLSATIQHAPGARTVQVLIPGVEVIELDLTQPEMPPSLSNPPITISTVTKTLHLPAAMLWCPLHPRATISFSITPKRKRLNLGSRRRGMRRPE
jgi:hypothetical protein